VRDQVVLKQVLPLCMRQWEVREIWLASLENFQFILH